MELNDRLKDRMRALEEIAYCAAELLDGHDEIVGETCKACVKDDETHGERLERLVDDFLKR